MNVTFNQLIFKGQANLLPGNGQLQDPGDKRIFEKIFVPLRSDICRNMGGKLSHAQHQLFNKCCIDRFLPGFLKEPRKNPKDVRHVFYDRLVDGIDLQEGMREITLEKSPQMSTYKSFYIGLAANIAVVGIAFVIANLTSPIFALLAVLLYKALTLPIGGLFNLQRKDDHPKDPLLEVEPVRLSKANLFLKAKAYLALEPYFQGSANQSDLYQKIEQVFRDQEIFPTEGEEATEDDLYLDRMICLLSVFPEMRSGVARIYKEISGMDEIKAQLIREVIYPIVSGTTTITPPNGILLYGPPGCGKTHIAQTLAKAIGGAFVPFSLGSNGSKYLNETAMNIQKMFDDAKARAKKGEYTVIFVDEADAIFSDRSQTGFDPIGQAKVDVVAQFLKNMDNCQQDKILLVAATNHLNKLDQAIIRDGRIDLVIEIPQADENTRIALFKECIGSQEAGANNSEINYNTLAKETENFPASSIKAVVQAAKRTVSFSGARLSTGALLQATGKVRRKIKALKDLRAQPNRTFWNGGA